MSDPSDPNAGVMFTRSAAQQIADAVRRMNSQSHDGSGSPFQSHMSGLGFWAQITGNNMSLGGGWLSSYTYAWQEQYDTAGPPAGMQARPSTGYGQSGTETVNPAYNSFEVTGGPLYPPVPNGSFVWMQETFDDANPANPVYRFTWFPQGMLIEDCPGVKQFDTTLSFGPGFTVSQGNNGVFLGTATVGLNLVAGVNVTIGISGCGVEISATGASGYSGYSGFSGFSGFSGYSGYSGFSGPQGLQGLPGQAGTSGYSGYSGATGSSGFSGAKAAIILLDGAWRGLFCSESPQAWFFDVITVVVRETFIDPLFIEACEPGLQVMSAHCDRGRSDECRVEGNKIVAQGDFPIRVTLIGLRKGFAQRFPIFTEQQATRNAAFWDSAHA